MNERRQAAVVGVQRRGSGGCAFRSVGLAESDRWSPEEAPSAADSRLRIHLVGEAEAGRQLVVGVMAGLIGRAVLAGELNATFHGYPHHLAEGVRGIRVE